MSSAPSKFTRNTDFAAFSTGHPGEQQPGVDIDAEFDEIKDVTDAIIDRVAEIQRDDGKLKNLSVHADALSSSVRAMIASGQAGEPKGDWAVDTSYVATDLVSSGNATYIAVSDHVAGADFATDLAAGKWLLLSSGADLTLGTYFEYFTGTGSAQVLTLSQDFGTNELAVEVYVKEDGTHFERMDPANYVLSGASLSGTFPSGVRTVLVFSAATATAALAAAAAASATASASSASASAASAVTAAAQVATCAASAVEAAASAASAASSASALGSAIAPRGHIDGLMLSTAGSSATFAIAAGVCTDGGGTAIMALAAFTKTTSAWSLGSGGGALDTGAIANNTWYHVWLIQRSDTLVVDVLVSLSATAPTMPTNYNRKRRIGSMKTNGSAQWTRFFQTGDFFEWEVPVQDQSNSSGTSAVALVLTVPTGFSCIAVLLGYLRSSVATNSALISSGLSTQALGVPSGNETVNQQVNSGFTTFTAQVPTNTSAQVRVECNDGAPTAFRIVTRGWFDQRGKNG